MKHTLKILILSVAIVVVPFLGFPGSWKTFLIVAFGLAIAVLAFLDMLRVRYQDQLASDTRSAEQHISVNAHSSANADTETTQN